MFTQTFHNELNKVFSAGESALEEPHDDDVVGQGDGVVVELEGVGVGERDGKHRHVLVVVEACKDLKVVTKPFSKDMTNNNTSCCLKKGFSIVTRQ